MIAPHGPRKKLVGRILSEKEGKKRREEAHSFDKITLSGFALSELDNIACGLYSPLTGFMTEESYRSVIEEMCLPDGTIWPIPIVLPIEKGLASNLRIGEPVALYGADGQIYGIMWVEEIFQRDVNTEARAVFGTTSPRHPGVKHIVDGPKWLLGGEIQLVARVPVPIAEARFDPLETRAMFEQRDWSTVVAFQTRNPIHRAHEYLQKSALEIVDGLFVNPLIGMTKPGDIPAAVRMDCYRVMMENYFPSDRVILGTFPAPMRYAGPREAVFHAICRKNYGCTHIIIGRDHAGVGDYYGTYAAQEIFDRFTPEELGITPLKFEHAFYCKRCGQMATRKTCPHGKDEHVFLSGTKVRELLRKGKSLPGEFTRPEVAQILKNSM
ncbi:MAG: sulfate adenylyltransferase [Candidatus Bipolaricaulota bacterium]|nr:sulfate adenylyltransferase [Candidatus Bipolaricaulota bacterium]